MSFRRVVADGDATFSGFSGAVVFQMFFDVGFCHRAVEAEADFFALYLSEEGFGAFIRDKFAVVDDGDLVAKLFGFLKVVGGEEDGDPLFIQGLYIVPELFS